MSRPLVFVHGLMGSPAAWDAVVDAAGLSDAALAPGREIVRPWLPGHGPGAPPSAETYAAAVDAFAADLPQTPADFVAYSMGARVVLSLAARHPGRVASAVLIGVHPGLEAEARAARVAIDDARATAIEAAGLRAFVDAWETESLFETQRALAADVRARRRAERLAHRPEGIAWALRTLGLGRMPPVLRIPTRAHLVTGARDARFGRIARALADGAASTTHAEIAGAGHDVALEAPRALAREIAVFLADRPATHAAAPEPHP